ncbi:MAG TPA: arginine--tRNA ligase, partial [Candidatus Wunengus californicus]
MFEEQAVELLGKVGIKTSAEKLERPPQDEFGDLSFPCFELAKEQRRNPMEIANEIALKLQNQIGPVIDKVEYKG